MKIVKMQEDNKLTNNNELALGTYSSAYIHVETLFFSSLHTKHRPPEVKTFVK